ncbi:FtsW/RodA/SpoVE family cell cycle protein [Anaerosporobacter faecicola]|uniref:FtsW/RodA/SpoVE family cell cycle protein n=1 Tax=Anaerosporobacter faecicola TaxID=2718714 RepID=UPI00143CA1E6|nr:FtsW/RodA/SpoVE family cell cycle protein [Anaerosporobacter faecicola]
MFDFKQYDFKRMNYSLVVLILILVGIGTYLIQLVEPSDGKKQILGLVLGFMAMSFVAVVDYHYVCRFIWFIYLANIILLVMVFIPGIGKTQFDTQRWINLRVFDLQPSEVCKIMMIIVLAQFFTDRKDKMDKISTVILSAIMVILPVLLILKQPDLSSSMVMLFVYVIMIYAAGLSYKIIVPILAVGIPGSIALFWYIQQPYQKLLGDYQQGRILSFKFPEKYPDLVWQQENSVELIGSGRLYGKLFSGQSLELKSKSLPVSESDFIFSVVGEQLGFIGGCVIIGLLAIVIFKCLSVARTAKDRTGMLIATGISAMLMFQVFANIGVSTFILPNTGLPLPFISYGLSSLVSYMIGIGFILNVSLQRKNIRG